MDGEVRFCDDDNATDAERVELVKDHVHDGRLRALRRLDHGRLHGFAAVERLRIAVAQLAQQVSSQSFHCLPPLRISSARDQLASLSFGCSAMFVAWHGSSGL